MTRRWKHLRHGGAVLDLLGDDLLFLVGVSLDPRPLLDLGLLTSFQESERPEEHDQCDRGAGLVVASIASMMRC